VNAGHNTSIHSQHQQPILEAVMSASIYRITNTVNGKFYIGQTIQSLNKRWWAHRYNAIHKSFTTHLYNAIRKYGPESFTVELLEETTTDQLNDRERYWIAELQPAYNMTEGGEGGKPSDEVRAKMRAAKIGRKLSVKSCDKLSAAMTGKNHPMYGKKHSPESRAKMSASARNMSPETRAKINAAAQYKSPETCAKISAAKLGKTHSPETRIKMSATRLGKTHSPETRAKLSAAAKVREMARRNLRLMETTVLSDAPSSPK
jgi:group I intron endonuclease